MGFWTRFWVVCAAVSVALLTVATVRGGGGVPGRGRVAGGGRSPTEAAGAGDAGAAGVAAGPAPRQGDAGAGAPAARRAGGGPLQIAAEQPPDEMPQAEQGRAGAESLAAETAPGRRGASREPADFAQLRASRDKPISREVRELAAELTKDATNEVGKARAIYDWIAANITYDTEEWESIVRGAGDYIHDHSPKAVLERGSAVCIGYAWLFDDLCEAAGIEATWLVGDVRGYRGTLDDELVSSVRHAWNAVKLDDGKWHLLDATWGARQDGDGEASAADVERADYYFDTPPAQFVYDHQPEDESWQLLEESIPSQSAFAVLPNLKPTFFTNGLGLESDMAGVLRASSGKKAVLPFSAPRGVQVAATIGTGGGDFRRIRVLGSGDGGKAAVLPELAPGEYILRLYSGGGESRMLECSADFLIRME